jgi:anti-sigma regulatory factor (Ser/Thr protein kinase)
VTRSSGQTAPPLQLCFSDADHKPLAGVRRTTSAWLAAAGVARDARDDVVLVTTELLHNAFRHGGPGPINLGLSQQDRGREVEVTVDSAAPPGAVPSPAEWRLPAGYSGSGRGLAIVAALAQAARVMHRNGRVLIAVRIGVA